jgi:hypothetical protein
MKKTRTSVAGLADGLAAAELAVGGSVGVAHPPANPARVASAMTVATRVLGEAETRRFILIA